MNKFARAAIAAVLLPMTLSAAQAVPFIYSVAAPNAAGIQSEVDKYRASLGALNPNVSGSFAGGRREINWDGVPNAQAAPNALPGDFFNSVVSPRGIEMTTPGSGLQVSANAGVASIEFGNIDPNYPDLFAPFSAQRLFTATDSNIVDVRFFVPGTSTAALTNGFGAVFTDVDLADSTSIEYFDQFDVSLGIFFVPSIAGNETLSFLGVEFPEGLVVSHVRITSGNQILGPGNTSTDLVVMDDFIFGEPMQRQVPEPTTGTLLAAALLAALAVGTSRRSAARHRIY